MVLPDPSFWNGKRVFITGAAGFKGKWLVNWLYQMGSIIGTNGSIDICDKETLSICISEFQPEIVIHMAAVSTVSEAFSAPIKAVSTNAIGTLTLLEILRGLSGVKAILNVTTDKVYHQEGIDRGYVESDRLGGLENYAISKVCSEHISTVYQKTYGLPLATVRAGNVLGGGDWKISRIIPNYIQAYKNRSVLEVNANAVRPWQYVLDCLCGYLLLCEKLYHNDAYVGAWNFASNEYESRSVQWVVDEMNRYFIPTVKYRLINERGFYETKNLKLCSDKAHKILKWSPKYSMEETVQHTAWWYKAHLDYVDTELLYNTELNGYLA